MAAVQATDPKASILAALNVARESASSSGADTQSRFLTLLTTQIRNQDPLNPLDNAQMTSQLAQISTVDGIERLNATLQALMSSASESTALDAAALLGHGVLVPGTGLALADGRAIGGVELAEAADRVRVTVKDAAGMAVRTLDLGALAAGSHVFRWDGRTDTGAEASAGRYVISVEALRGDAKVAAEGLELGVVSSVARGAEGVLLDLGTLGAYRLADIRRMI